jgi:hypothetical protein
MKTNYDTTKATTIINTAAISMSKFAADEMIAATQPLLTKLAMSTIAPIYGATIATTTAATTITAPTNAITTKISVAISTTTATLTTSINAATTFTSKPVNSLTLAPTSTPKAKNQEHKDSVATSTSETSNLIFF